MPKKSIMQTRVEAAREAKLAKLADLEAHKEGLLSRILGLQQQLEGLNVEAARLEDGVAELDALLAAPEEDEPEGVEA